MNDEQIWSTLTQVFRTVFDRDTIEIGPSTTARDVEEWDSLNYVQLILAVESAFKVRFKPTEVASFECVGDLAAAIKRQTSA